MSIEGDMGRERVCKCMCMCVQRENEEQKCLV
jgi:hypothetical protein